MYVLFLRVFFFACHEWVVVGSRAARGGGRCGVHSNSVDRRNMRHLTHPLRISNFAFFIFLDNILPIPFRRPSKTHPIPPSPFLLLPPPSLKHSTTLLHLLKFPTPSMQRQIQRPPFLSHTMTTCTVYELLTPFWVRKSRVGEWERIRDVWVNRSEDRRVRESGRMIYVIVFVRVRV